MCKFKFISKYLILLFALIFIHISLNAQQIENVALQLKWKHQFQFAGYYAAIENGYYEDYGLKVSLIEAVEGQNPSDAVFEGRAEFGVCTSDILIMRQQNKNAVVLATIFQHSPQILLASRQRGIEHVHDLLGKTIAMEPNAADIIAFMSDEGVTQDKFIIDHHSFNADRLISGEIDAISAYNTDELFIVKEAIFDYTIISPLMGGIDFYGDVLFTTETLINDNPVLVENFRKASIKGWKYAMDNPEQIIDLIYNKYTKRHSIDHLRFEADHMRNLILSNVVEVGYTNPGRWKSIANTYKNLKMLDSSFSNEGLLYTDYLEHKVIIPWKLISIFLVIILIIGSMTYYYYSSSKKIKHAEQRIKIKNDELLKINAEKDKFFSIIAHDLKGPFNSIVGFSDLLAEKVKVNDFNGISEYTDIIVKSSHRVMDLLMNLMDWSLSQTGRMTFNPVRFNLVELIDDSILLFTDIANQKTIEVKKEMSTKIDVYADKSMLSAIMRNLISNAVKFSFPGGSVVISAKETLNEITIKINDAGVGISESAKEKIFRIDESYSTPGTNAELGTGLGLILCKEFVEEHGGKIWVDTIKGKGSSFYFTIPSSNVKHE